MPEIQAFRGLRYDLGHVGSLSDVVCPPYDVIDPELQDELYRRHPCNFVRVDHNRIEPGDDEADNRYTRATRFLKNWVAEGVLFREADPAIYVYHQEFVYAGRQYVRRGFMASMLLSPFGQGLVFPHEQTFSAPKLDRLMLTVVTKAALSPVFALYPDPNLEVDALLEAAVAGKVPLVATDPWNAVHRLWPVTEVGIIGEVCARMASKPVFIADGHHRYETACKYREEVYESGALRKDHPARYTLMAFVAMEDPGLVVLPTHRLFRDLPALTAEQLVAKLGDCFEVRPGGQGPDQAASVWDDLQTGGDPRALAIFTREDARWTILHMTERGRARLAAASPDHIPEWRELGTSVLHRLVIESLLGLRDLSHTRYVHQLDDVVNGLRTGQYPLAALVIPPTVADLRSISIQGDRLPPKSSYFYPKALSGLVVYPLE